MSDTTSALPDGWEMHSVEQLAEPNGIAYGVLKPGPQTPTGVPMLRVSDVREGRVDLSALYMIGPELDNEFQRTKLRGGEIVISIQGSVGRVAVVPPELTGANVSRTLAMIRLTDPSLAPWVHRALESPDVQAAMRGAIGGTTRDSLNLRDLRKVEIPIPPVGVRTELLKLIEATSSRVASSTAHLDRSRRAVERFRQSVFAAACSGRLTADWREAHPSTPSATLLIDEIRNARAEVRKAIEPVAVARPDNEETPDTWMWVRFGSVIGELRNGVSIAPAMEPPGVPILRISAARPRRVDLNDLRYLREDGENWAPFKLRDGDLLFTRYNGSLSLLGVCGMVRNLGDRTILHPDKLMKVRFDHHLIEPEFVEIFFASPLARARMTAGSVSSAGQQGISGATVKDQLLAIPPLEEQRVIVGRVNELLERADVLETRFETVSERVGRSSQAVLARAFRGELSAAATMGEESI